MPRDIRVSVVKCIAPFRLSSHISWEPIFARGIRLSCLLSCQVVDPSPIRLHFLPFAHRRCQVKPAQGVTDSTDLVADGIGCITAHPVVKVIVSQ